MFPQESFKGAHCVGAFDGPKNRKGFFSHFHDYAEQASGFACPAPASILHPHPLPLLMAQSGQVDD